MRFKEYYNEATHEVIYRALPFSADDTFRVGDYVTKSERFALEHGETSAIYNGEDYKVIRGLVSSDSIKPANNPGEFLMVQDVVGKGIWKLVMDDVSQTVNRERIRNVVEGDRDEI
jgi:hypothetical protein